MTDYIETKTEEGATILIEVEPSPKMAPGFGHKPPSGDVSGDMSQEVYRRTLDTVRLCANGLIETLQNLEATPHTASIDFAIKIDPEAGAMVAKSGSDAQFKISLSWKQPDDTDDEDED